MPATKQQCRKYRQRLKDRAALIAGLCCRKCGKGHDLEFAHVKQTKLSGDGRGLTHRMLDVIHNPTSYIRLCKGCHKELDG